MKFDAPPSSDRKPRQSIAELAETYLKRRAIGDEDTHAALESLVEQICAERGMEDDSLAVGRVIDKIRPSMAAELKKKSEMDPHEFVALVSEHIVAVQEDRVSGFHRKANGTRKAA